MNSDWIGKSISLDCGEMGFLQGTIKSVQLDAQTITITDAFRNGKHCEMTSITVRACDIQDLTFLEPKSAVSKSSTIQVGKKKPKPVAENLMTGGGRTQPARFSPAMAEAGKLPVGGRFPPAGPRTQTARFSPAMAAALGQRNNSPRKPADGARSFDRQTPNRKERDRLKDEDCFGEIVEEEMSQEFDFEMNLALFDKKLVFEEIDGELTQRNQPDVVRLVDCNRRRKDDVTPGVEPVMFLSERD